MSTSAYGHGLPGVPSTMLAGRGQVLFRPDRDLMARRAAVEKLAQRCPQSNPDPMKALMSGQYRIPDEVTSDLGMNAVQQYNVNQRLYEISQSNGSAVQMRQDLAALAREADLADDARRFLQTRGIAYCMGQVARKSGAAQPLMLRKAKKKGGLIEGKGCWQYAKEKAREKGKGDAYAAAIANRIMGKSEARSGACLFMKAGGTRGGKYIKREGSPGNYRYTYAEPSGTTQSGKPVTRVTAGIGHHPGYEKQDHLDAQKHHQDLVAKLQPVVDQKRKDLATHDSDKFGQMYALSEALGAHKRAVEYHGKKAGEITSGGAPNTTPLDHPAYKKIRRAAYTMNRVETDKTYVDNRPLVEDVNDDYAEAADEVRAAMPSLGKQDHARLRDHHLAEAKRLSKQTVSEAKESKHHADVEHHIGIARVHEFLSQHPHGKKFTPYDAGDYGDYGDGGDGGDGGDEDLHRSLRKANAERHGLPITVERKAGRLHHWQAKDGTSGTRRQLFDYGYIDNTLGADGEEYDVFLGPNKNAKTVFIVHQNKTGSGKYDEDKAMVGFGSEAEAKAAYLASYGGKEGMLRNISSMPVDAFKRMVRKMKKSKTDGRGDEKDSAASIRGKVLARKLKEQMQMGKCMLRKSTGEGSRGGRIIGHTKNGKPIYAYGNEAFQSYTRRDHRDAAKAHLKEAGRREKEKLDMRSRGVYAGMPHQAEVHHKQKAKEHTRAANGEDDSMHKNDLKQSQVKNTPAKQSPMENTMNKAGTVDVGGDPLAFLGIKTVDLSENGGNGGTYATGNPGAPDTSNSNATVGDAPQPPVKALSADDVTNAFLQGTNGGVGSAITPMGTYAAPPSTEYINNEVPLVDPLNIPTTVLSAEAKDDQGAMNSVLNQNGVMKSHFWADGGNFQVPEADMWSQADLVSKGATTISSEVVCKSCNTHRPAMINSCTNCGAGVVFNKSFLDACSAFGAAPGAQPEASYVDASQGLRIDEE